VVRRNDGAASSPGRLAHPPATVPSRDAAPDVPLT
jgi:hypothetical protein